MSRRIILLSKLVELVAEDVGIPQRLLLCRRAEDKQIMGYAIAKESAFTAKSNELIIDRDSATFQRLQSNISCFIPIKWVRAVNDITAYIFGSDLDKGFLVIQGKTLLSRDELVKKYGVWVED